MAYAGMQKAVPLNLPSRPPVPESPVRSAILLQLYCGMWITKDLLACGGSEPNMMRVVDVSSLMTVASVSNFTRGVYSLDFGEVRNKRARTARKFTTSKGGAPLSEDGYPLRVGLCAGKKILECDLT